MLHFLLQIINVLVMKENGSENSTMLNRNWVLKRKRRKLPSGTDKSRDRGKIYKPVKFPSSTRLKNDLKEDNSLGQCSGKRKGNDGVSYLYFSFPCYFLCLFCFYNQLLEGEMR